MTIAMIVLSVIVVEALATALLLACLSMAEERRRP